MGLWGTDYVLRKGAYSSVRIQSMCWSGTFSPAFPTRFWTAQAHCWTTHATERDFNIEQTKLHTARGPPWHLLSWNFSLTFAGGGEAFITRQLSQKGWKGGGLWLWKWHISFASDGVSGSWGTYSQTFQPVLWHMARRRGGLKLKISK